MIPFFGLTEAELAAWRSAMGVSATSPLVPQPIVNCELCDSPIDFGETYVECEPAPPGNRKRLFHETCLTVHLIRNENNPNDEITLFVTRKPICNTEIPNSNSPTTSSESFEDDSHFGDL